MKIRVLKKNGKFYVQEYKEFRYYGSESTFMEWVTKKEFDNEKEAIEYAKDIEPVRWKSW